MDRETRKVFLTASVNLYKCPNTGRVIDSIKGDDKVICPCGKQNPKGPTESSGGIHHVRFLETATPDQYIDQHDADEKKRKRQS